MTALSRHPRTIQLAKDLGLSIRGDCLAHIRQHALAKAGKIVSDAPVPADSLERFRRLVADKYRVRVEFIYEDSDVGRISSSYPSFHTGLAARLNQEFLNDTTEGLTLERDEWDPRVFRYLAVIDARGTRASRAYFTAWHEITHLVLHPEQLPFPGFRRTPTSQEIEKDPLESVVDHVAGRLGFFRPLFSPILQEAVAQNSGAVCFRAFDSARAAILPEPSLFSTAMGSLELLPEPMLLVEVGLAYKKSEARELRSTQASFDFAKATPKAALRVVKAVPNEAARNSSLAIHPNMRVPQDSVLTAAFENAGEIGLAAVENQGSWETRSEGPLPTLPLHVEAIRRGRFVYGLIGIATKSGPPARRH
jgi:hypothetical protein